jgi:flavodoxin I
MKALVVYDSVYGNTEKIAKAIGEAIAPSGEVKLVRVGEANPSQLTPVDLLIVGSPTHAGRPVQAVQEFLKKVPEGSLKGVNVAAFDTRISRRIVGVFGYAAGRIAGSLKKKGGSLVGSPEGFFVTEGQGPLKERELERAAAWAKGILGAKK